MTWCPDGRGGAESGPYRVSIYAGGGWLASVHRGGGLGVYGTAAEARAACEAHAARRAS